MSFATQGSHLYAGGDSYGEVPQYEHLDDEDEEDVESESRLLNSEEMNPEFRGEHTSYSNNEPGFQSENPNQSQKSGIPVCMELAANILPEILEEAPSLTTNRTIICPDSLVLVKRLSPRQRGFVRQTS